MDPERPSLGKVYDAISDVRTDLAVIKATLSDIADHETRIRAIEKRQWSFAGIAAVAGAALSGIVDRLFT